MEPTRTIPRGRKKIIETEDCLGEILGEKQKAASSNWSYINLERERKKGEEEKDLEAISTSPVPLVPLLREPFSPSKDKIVYTVGKKVAVKYRYNEPLSGPFKRGEPEGGPFWEGGRRKRIENNKLKRLKKPTGRKFPSSPLSLTDREGKWTLDLVRREENSWIRVFRCWTTVGELVSHRPTSTFQLEGEGRGLGRT